MRAPDSIRVILQVRCRREELEERKLAAVIEKLRLAGTELANLSAELGRIATARGAEIQGVRPNTYHQAVEAHSTFLWRECAQYATEIERLEEARAKQLSVYMAARRERESMESLDKQRSEALRAERNLREQKLNEDLFLARRVANRDT